MARACCSGVDVYRDMEQDLLDKPMARIEIKGHFQSNTGAKYYYIHPQNILLGVIFVETYCNSASWNIDDSSRLVYSCLGC